MNRLIKSQLYKIKHSYATLRIWAIIFVVITITPIASCLSELDSFSQATVENGIKVFAPVNIVYYVLIIPIVICIQVGKGYRNKTSYYEVMDGHKTIDIINSRLLVSGVIVLVAILSSLSIGLVFLQIVNGTGDLPNKLGVRIFLLIITILHISTVSTLFTLIFKSDVVAGLVLYLRFAVFDSIMCIALPDLFEELKCIGNWLINGQWTSIWAGNVNSALIIGVIISCLVETGGLYLLAVRSFNKKEFK